MHAVYPGALGSPFQVLWRMTGQHTYLLESEVSHRSPEPLLTCLVELSQWQEDALLPVPAGAAPHTRAVSMAQQSSKALMSQRRCLVHLA